MVKNLHHLSHGCLSRAAPHIIFHSDSKSPAIPISTLTRKFRFCELSTICEVLFQFATSEGYRNGNLRMVLDKKGRGDGSRLEDNPFCLEAFIHFPVVVNVDDEPHHGINADETLAQMHIACVYCFATCVDVTHKHFVTVPHSPLHFLQHAKIFHRLSLGCLSRAAPHINNFPVVTQISSDSNFQRCTKIWNL